MFGLFHPFRKIVGIFNNYRINKWLTARHEGIDNGVALKAAWLSPLKAYAILLDAIGTQMGSVGVLTISSRGLNVAGDMDQMGVLMTALAHLYPALPAAEQEQLMHLFKTATGHNWGYVRRAASAALAMLVGHPPHATEP